MYHYSIQDMFPGYPVEPFTFFDEKLQKRFSIQVNISSIFNNLFMINEHF